MRDHRTSQQCAESISRSRTGVTRHQPLLNESELKNALSVQRFSIAEICRFPLAERVRLLANSKTEIAPPDIGFANIVYITSGAQFLELQLEHYVHGVPLFLDSVLSTNTWLDVISADGLG